MFFLPKVKLHDVFSLVSQIFNLFLVKDFLLRLIGRNSRNNKTKSHRRVIKLESQLQIDDMDMIAELVNDYEMFEERVSPEFLFSLFCEEAARPICVQNLMPLAFLLDKLSVNGLIGRCWQTALANKGSLLQRNGRKAQTNSNFSTALYRANKFKRKAYENITVLAKQIALKHKNFCNNM